MSNVEQAPLLDGSSASPFPSFGHEPARGATPALGVSLEADAYATAGRRAAAAKHAPAPRRAEVVPDSTSAVELESYYGGKCLLPCRGDAWREVKASLFEQPAPTGQLRIPSISEPVLLWVRSGEAEVQDREIGGSWETSLVK